MDLGSKINKKWLMGNQPVPGDWRSPLLCLWWMIMYSFPANHKWGKPMAKKWEKNGLQCMEDTWLLQRRVFPRVLDCPSALLKGMGRTPELKCRVRTQGKPLFCFPLHFLPRPPFASFLSSTSPTLSLGCLLLVSSWKEKNDSTFPCVFVLLSMLSKDSPPLKAVNR